MAMVSPIIAATVRYNSGDDPDFFKTLQFPRTAFRGQWAGARFLFRGHGGIYTGLSLLSKTGAIRRTRKMYALCRFFSFDVRQKTKAGVGAHRRCFVRHFSSRRIRIAFSPITDVIKCKGLYSYWGYGGKKDITQRAPRSAKAAKFLGETQSNFNHQDTKTPRFLYLPPSFSESAQQILGESISVWIASSLTFLAMTGDCF